MDGKEHLNRILKLHGSTGRKTQVHPLAYQGELVRRCIGQCSEGSIQKWYSAVLSRLWDGEKVEE